MTRPLRPYQKKNAAEILALLERGVRGVLYGLPTAGGKTVVSSSVIATVAAAGWSVVFLVHRRELLQQSLRQLAAVGIRAGIVDADHDPDPDMPVHVASIDTLKARKRRLADWLRTIRLAVIDEAHHTVAPGWRDLLDAMEQAQRFGLTATPFRGDGKPLGDMFDAVVRGPSVFELTAAGFLAPAEVWDPALNIDMSAVSRSRGDWVASDIARVMDSPEVTRAAIDQYAARMPGEPAIAFCATVDHARHVADAFTRAGWCAVSVDGGMSVDERDAAIKGLAGGRFQVLTSCEIVSEGTDIPVVSGAILLRQTLSILKYMQQVGRVLRLSPGKTRACIVDLAGNAKLHGLPDAERIWTLETGLLPVQHRTIRCPACHRRFAAGPECPSCGRRFRGYETAAPARQLDLLADSMIRALPVSELEAMARGTPDLERIARVRGFAAGWVWHAHKRLLERGAAKPAAARPAPSPTLVSMPGMRGWTDEQIRVVELSRLLPRAKDETDLRRIAAVKNLPDGWVREHLRHRVEAARRFG